MGLVTKYAGGVVKGFALIAGITHIHVYIQLYSCLFLHLSGILITGFAQYVLESKALGFEHWCVLLLLLL